MTSQVFALGPAKAPWGDYGRILLHGMSSHLPRENGTIQLERTGPFVPPLSFPGVGDVIATDATVEMLATSGLTPVQWKPVAKRRIAELDWRSWDLSASSPAALPPHGKPEAYVLENPHAPELAQAMPALWELEASVVGSGTQQRLGRGRYEITVTVDAEPPDFFRTNGLRHLLVSERAADWLKVHLGEWVTVEAVARTR